MNDENAKQKSTTSVPAGTDQESSPDAKRRAILATRLKEDRDDSHHHCGADARKDLDHRAQASSGDSMGTGNQEVEPSVTLTRIENHGNTDAEIVRLEFGRRYLFDKP